MRSKKATLVLHDKVILRNGVIVESKIWKVPMSEQYPDGLRYSLFAVHEGRILVGYDNHHSKGHHRHLGEAQSPYHCTNLETLRNDFRADLELELSKRGLL